MLPASEIPTDELVARCKAGETAAFDILVGRYAQRVHRVCYHAIGDADEAADAAQDTFVRAWRSIGGFRGESALSTWLHRIALNVVHDRREKLRRAPLPFSSAPSSGDDDEPREIEIPDHAPTPEYSALAGERRCAVREAMRQLSDDHRAVLILFDIEGHSYEEVAAMLQLPMGTLKSRLSRARLALRDKLMAHRELFEA